MKEDIHFLKEFQEQMRYEDKCDNDNTKSPRFWVIGDYKWILANEDNVERYSVYLPKIDFTCPVNSLLKRHQEDSELSYEAVKEIDNIECEVSALTWIQKHMDKDAYLIPQEKVHIVREDTLFLTKADAERHMNHNRHYYTKYAHTYAMTAWRSPKFKKLLNILMNSDWDDLLKKLEGR